MTDENEHSISGAHALADHLVRSAGGVQLQHMTHLTELGEETQALVTSPFDSKTYHIVVHEHKGE